MAYNQDEYGRNDTILEAKREETKRERNFRDKEEQKEFDERVISQRKLNNELDQTCRLIQKYTDLMEDATDEEKAEYEYSLRILKNTKKLKEHQVAAGKMRIEQLKENKHIKTDNKREEKVLRETYKESDNKLTQNLKSRGGGNGKTNVVLGALSIVSDLASGVADMYIADRQKQLNTWLSEQDIYLKSIETSSKIFQRNLNAFSRGMNGALASSFASITQGVQEGAYSAASNSITFATETLKNTFDTALDRFKMSNFEVLRRQQTELDNLKLTNQQINKGAGMISGVASLFGPVGNVVGGILTSITSTVTKINEAESEMALKRLEMVQKLNESQLEKMNEAQKSAVDSAAESVSKTLDFARAIETLSVKTDAAAKSMGSIIGLPSKTIDMFENFIYKAAHNLNFRDDSGKTIYLNKSSEDMLKMQSAYIEASSRNNIMTNKDFVRSFQLGEVIGDDNLAAALLGDMDYFNKTIESSTELIFDMYQEANRAGVSNRKFAKDLQNNLKLAQKYTFKGGTESLMKMSIWAQKVRFNMQNLESIVDSIQSGSFEDVITKSARLQVLGGNMAIGSDPLGMYFEAWNSPEDLMKRFHNMTKGIGYFDEKTGEVNIQGADAMLLKAYADATGMDYQNAREQVTQRVKGEQIDRHLTRDYTPEQKALIYNKAKRNKNGEWVVSVLNEKNEVEEKSINDITGKEWNSLLPTEESIENYVAGIYSLLNQEGGVTGYMQNLFVDETSEDLRKNINERINENLALVRDNSQSLKEAIEESNSFVTEQNKQQHDLLVATTGILSQQFKLIENATKIQTENISNSGSELRLALDAVAKGVEYDLAKIRYENDDITKEEFDKFAEAAGISMDVLGKQMGIRNTRPSDDIDKAFMDLAGNLTQREFKYLRQQYEYSKKKHGDLSKYNKDTIPDSYDDLLTDNTGGREFLNTMAKYGIVNKEHNYISELTPYEFGELQKALERLLEKDENDNDVYFKDYEKYTNNYNPYYGMSAKEVFKSERENTHKLIQTIKQQTPSTKDSIMSGNGRPMLVGASNVIPIKDGAVKVASTDPNDTAIFAKSGGPFDTLFNGVFRKVDSIYNGMSSKPTNINLTINGKLELTGKGGQSVNIIQELKNNPMFVRQITEMIALQFNNNTNGGRNELWPKRFATA